MAVLKRITQSITTILVVVIIIGTPLAMGRFLAWLGIVGWLDSLWSPTLFGWAIVLLSRAVLATVWVGGDYLTIVRGERGGWFWFAPERPTYGRDEPSVDKSGAIIAYTAVVFLVLVIFEFLFRVGAWANPPYLPPPE